MDKVIEWLTQKFSHPLTLLFFLLGVVLLLLGLTTGFEIPVLQQVAPALEYQGVSLVLGVICLMFSLVVYYKPPPKKQSDYKSRNEKTTIELPVSFFARKALISKTQTELLHFIENQKSTLISDIQIIFTDIATKELFYRLEQLRLLGFIEKKTIGQHNSTTNTQVYYLSKKYQAEIMESFGYLPDNTTTESPPFPNKRKRRNTELRN